MDRTLLSEYESEMFLSAYGIPVCREALASDPGTAASLAVRIGFPVALKASGPSLSHKTDIGGIVLNITSEEKVREEGQRLLEVKGCDALLIQEMIEGDRELACGLTRDQQLGPCVMFGLGGILTELLDDVSFRLAPLDSLDAHEMMKEIRSYRIMKPFRGEPAVNIETVARILVKLGEIGIQHAEVAAIDINPLKIRDDGAPIAVDALVVFQPGFNSLLQPQIDGGSIHGSMS